MGTDLSFGREVGLPRPAGAAGGDAADDVMGAVRQYDSGRPGHGRKVPRGGKGGHEDKSVPVSSARDFVKIFLLVVGQGLAFSEAAGGAEKMRKT